MNRFLVIFLCLFSSLVAMAQGSVKGKLLDKSADSPLEFASIQIKTRPDGKFLKGAMTDVDGKFQIDGLADGDYTMVVSCVGYKELTRDFSVSPAERNVSFAALYISQDAHLLKEVSVTGQKSTMKLEVDRKTFDVSQLITNTGDAASDLLENIPSVEVDNDGNISLRGNESVEVWINGKASGLTTDNRAQILQQLPAESIERIEVIDNPSAKFSAEGSAGIINIVLKKDRKAGYYGSVQLSADTRGGFNPSVNFNYNSKILDFFVNVGYRHHKNKGRNESEQQYLTSNMYQKYVGSTRNLGNNFFSRAGVTFHLSKKDDLGFSGMLMFGKHKDWGETPYHYGMLDTETDTYLMFRKTTGGGNMRMINGELSYRHNFSDKHFIDFSATYFKGKFDNDNLYQDSTFYYDGSEPTEYDYQYRPANINNSNAEIKLDYENQITEKFKLQAGYNGSFSRENTPQESWIASTWDGSGLVEDQTYFNRFLYDRDTHALYVTAQYQFGKLGVMTGLRGEYWKVNTESYTWAQEHDANLRDEPFKKDYFQLFPSLFLSYQLTATQQLQLNYTRRLRRPWGGQLNSFKDTRDATMVSYGNPELTPEYSNSFSLNYLKTWDEHSLLVSAYYRPTTDVIQRIKWQSTTDQIMYSTNMNLAKSLSSGLEITLKNHLFRILDLTSNVNAYYYKLDGFSYEIDGQTITGDENKHFTWNARVMASVILPYDISVQLSGRYRSKQVITQGYRKPSYVMDFGMRKNFFNKALTVSLNCRDLLNSRKHVTYTSSDTFTRYQMNKRGSRTFRLTLTWNFGNMNKKQNRPQENGDYEVDPNQQYNGGDQ